MPKKKKAQESAAGAETAKGITAITVAGFKSIRDEQTIEIRPLTILAGANSSGKSSIMQPLLLMKQTLEARYDPGVMLLDGPLLKFNLVEELLSQPIRSVQEAGIKVGITSQPAHPAHPGWTLTTVFKRLPHGDGLHIPEMSIAFPKRSTPVSFRPEMKSEDIVAVLPEALRSAIDRLGRNLILRVVRRRCFLSLEMGFADESANSLLMVPLELTPDLAFENVIVALMYLPGLRGVPERAYPRAHIGLKLPGVFTAYVAGLVAKWQAENDARLVRASKLLEHLALTWKIEARFPDDAHIALYVPRRKRGAKGSDNDLVNIADVGLGVSQALPVVVALVAAEPGQLVYIEQPELHLHPRAQVAMAEVLADAAKRGVRVVAETHSSLLLLGIQTLVAEGKLSPDLVKLHWFSRNKEGFTQITSTNLDEAGRFETDWPEDFGDVELDLQGRYLDATEKRQLGL